jgi:subtilase family serine protease
MIIRKHIIAACAATAVISALWASANPAAARGRGAALPLPRPACAAAPTGHARCFVLFAPQSAASAQLNGGGTGPPGWGARQIEAAYKLPAGRDPHQTVAVVDAFHIPGLASYLAFYRKHYGLPACTPAGGCFREVNQAGRASPLPASGQGSGWDLETTLDVSMVSAACPHCQILVVEANNDSDASLAAAEDTAARLGANAISNSYGDRESGLTQTYARAYNHPGHAIVASSGDSGFLPAQFPANLATVTAVGGTDLARARNRRGWTEKAWFFGGSGCSAYVAKPAWQHDPHCPMRTVADVSAVASNVPIYDKYWGGWTTVAGTSIAAPLIAGTYALAGNAATITPRYPYLHARSLFDVTTGTNDVAGSTGKKPGTGRTCGYDYLCVARKGYDAPTGLGTPHGTRAF